MKGQQRALNQKRGGKPEKKVIKENIKHTTAQSGTGTTPNRSVITRKEH
jgi:hypothetical protein